jgi:CRP/FNR family transcriptional regulator
MTRADIGSYLGLELETVSRMLSRLQREGAIALSGRQVRIVDRARLARI